MRDDLRADGLREDDLRRDDIRLEDLRIEEGFLILPLLALTLLSFAFKRMRFLGFFVPLIRERIPCFLDFSLALLFLRLAFALSLSLLSFLGDFLGPRLEPPPLDSSDPPLEPPPPRDPPDPPLDPPLELPDPPLDPLLEPPDSPLDPPLDSLPELLDPPVELPDPPPELLFEEDEELPTLLIVTLLTLRVPVLAVIRIRRVFSSAADII